MKKPHRLFATLLGSFAVAAAASFTAPATSEAGDSLFYGDGPYQGPYSLGKAVLQSNERLARNWFFEVTAGPLFGAGGDFTNSTDGSIHGVDSWARNMSFDDIYDNAWLYGFRVGKRVGDHSVYFRFAYTHADAEATDVGGAAGSALKADFDEYSDFGLLFGIEREFLQPSRIHPYIGVEAGFRFTQEIGVDFQSEAFGSTGSLALYDETVVFSAALTAGVAFDVTDTFQIGLESGLRYQGALDDSDADLDAYGFDKYNTSDSILFVPLLLTGTWYF